ncbi:MAG: threonine-phosphate decarboxylase CobD [Thermodesulfobacteriota bacterium]
MKKRNIQWDWRKIVPYGCVNNNSRHGGDIWRIAKELGRQPGEVIDFSASINPFGISVRALAAIKDSAGHLGHYPEPGAEAIRRELASYHNLPEKNIIVGNGSTEFIYLIPQVFRPEKALIIEPAFSEYRRALEVSGCKVDSYISAESNGFYPELDGLFAELERDYDILFLANPANPTSALLDKDTIMDIARRCHEHGTILVVDEVFIDFVEEESIKEVAAIRDNLIVLRSMTKFFSMAGLRLGYIVAHKEIISSFAHFSPPWSVNTLAIIAGVESLRDMDYIQRSKKWLRAEKSFVQERLEHIPYLKAYPSEANFLLVRIMLDGIKARDIQEYLLKEGILIRDCGSFTGLGEDFFRIAIRERVENKILLDKLERFFKESSRLLLDSSATRLLDEIPQG